MGSREKDQSKPNHPPVISSLVVRPSSSGGGGDPAVNDYEPGEVRRDPPPCSRSVRNPDYLGFRMHAGSASPMHQRNADHRFCPDFDHSRGSPFPRGFGSARDTDRYRDFSPPFGRRDGIRFSGKPFDGPGIRPRPSRSEGMPRNNINVQPREGDWMCPDPLCNNLNFARREYCNKCHRSRYAPVRSPRRGYPGPIPPPPRRFPGPPMDQSPMRGFNGYRSPPHGLPRDGPRDFAQVGSPRPRHDGRFPDHHMLKERLDFPEDFYGERNRPDRPVKVDWGFRDSRPDRPVKVDWGLRDRGRVSFFNERQPPSPSPPPTLLPQRGCCVRDIRERSRSPVRGVPPSKDYRRDVYVERVRDGSRVMGRDRFHDAY